MGEFSKLLSDNLEKFIKLFDFNQTSYFTKAGIADSVNEHKIFGFPKSSKFLAVFDDFLRELCTDVRKFFEFLSRSRVDIDRRLGNYNLILS